MTGIGDLLAARPRNPETVAEFIAVGACPVGLPPALGLARTKARVPVLELERFAWPERFISTHVQCDFNACGRQNVRRQFLDGSNPFASFMKGMWEISDPALQKPDQAEIMTLSVGSSNISRAGILRRKQAA